jgi:hypothetical protein
MTVRPFRISLENISAADAVVITITITRNKEAQMVPLDTTLTTDLGVEAATSMGLEVDAEVEVAVAVVAARRADTGHSTIMLLRRASMGRLTIAVQVAVVEEIQ